MDEINKIRKAYFARGESINTIAKEFNRSWETVKRIVSMDRKELNTRGKRPNRGCRVTTPEVVEAIEGYLDEEEIKKVRKKQRYTARKIYKDLKARDLYKGSERQIQSTVKKLREKRGQRLSQSYLPLSFPLGSALQIDHGEADLVIGNVRQTGYLFVASVPGYALRYYQAFPVKSREAWGEFHERAFRFFGGVFPRVAYDNDSVLIKKVMGRERRQTEFSQSLEEHFGFESHFCNPSSGNEKGSVENSVGYGRRNFLTGCPFFLNWDECNTYLQTSCLKDISEGKHYKTKEPLKFLFDKLRQAVKPLPQKKFWFKWVDCRVDSYQMISVDNHNYSVPERYVGSFVRVALGIFQVKIYKDEELIATHARSHDESDSLQLDHYLDQLQRKPGAFWDCKVVQDHEFDDLLLEVWRRLLTRSSKNVANREFVKILLLGKHYSQKELLTAVEQCLKYGAIDHSSVENIIRQPRAEQPVFSESTLKKALEFIDIQSWQCNITSYAELCEEVPL